MFGTTMQDVRFAVRTLRKQPMFTLVAMLTLALGIGANTAVFSVVSGVLLSPLPYPAPDRLIAVWPNHFGSNGELVYLQEHARSYDGGAAAFSPGWGMVLSLPNEAVQLAGARTSSNFFRVLGARPALGRTFNDDESRPGSDRVAVLSHELWSQRFGADPRIVGRMVTIDGEKIEVIGVMTPSFRFVQAKADLWLPLVLDPTASFYKTGGTSFLLGRLAGSATTGSAATELATLIPPMRDALGFEAAYGRDASVVPLRDAVVGGLRQTLLILLCAVGFILLIAGANVGNLQLARAAGRRHEITIRAALGANRSRIIRQLLFESVVLSLGGGALGVVLGALGVRWLQRLLPADTPRLESISVDIRVLVACALATLGVGIIFGLAPALVASRTDLEGTLRGARSGAGGVAGRRTRASLVIAETALALVLVIAAGLMIQTLWRLSRVDAGFRPTNVLTMRVQPTSDTYDSRAKRISYFEQAVERVRGEQGV
ncbi:MAG: ABC transporter permease, partial [Gemmatimonadota bacterium]|nr:ABC transporter permease [Gemmatimonadota bacterium]